MKYIVRITDQGPLSFRAGRETTSAATLDYVPGSALLGGLAASHAQLRQDAAQFTRFFMSPSSSFGNLYPSSFAHDDLAGNLDPVYPLPSTALSCKRASGFKLDEEDPKNEPHHGVFDGLIPWTLFALSHQTQAEVLAPFKACPVCQKPLDRFAGFYRRDPYDAEAMGTARVSHGLRTRTGINRATGIVQQGILYSREVLRSEMGFWGTIALADDLAEEFYQFVQEANASGLLRLGNNRTRGFGQVTLALDPVDDSEAIQTLETHVEAFDAKLRRQAQDAGVETPHQLYVPLTLISDAILFDRLLRHRTAITPGDLEERWGIASAELVYQNSRSQRVMGWNDLWRLPKPDDLAITMGSVFVFGLSVPLTDDLLQTLWRMQTEGIGARRREGFGQFRIASPFHWEVKGQ